MKLKLVLKELDSVNTFFGFIWSLFVWHEARWIVFFFGVREIRVDPATFVVLRIEILEVIKVFFARNIKHLHFPLRIQHITVFLPSQPTIAVIWVIHTNIIIQLLRHSPRLLIVGVPIINKNEFPYIKRTLLVRQLRTIMPQIPCILTQNVFQLKIF